MNSHDCSWQGWLRPDGRKGIRNELLVIYTVECAGHVAHRIGESEDNVHVLGFSGCFDSPYVIRILSCFARHPNVGGVLCVGLGCEYTQPEKIAEVAVRSGRPAEWFYIQDSGGTLPSIEKGKELVRALKKRMSQDAKSVSMGWCDLVVAAECGGSDFTSGIAGNRVVGAFLDRLVDAGGTGVAGEIVELVGLKNALLARAANEKAAVEIESAYDKMIEYNKRVQQYSISPGNFAGGLTTIEEKSAGAYAKYGTRPLQGVRKVSQALPCAGMWMLDALEDEHFMYYGYTNPSDTQDVLEHISVGAHLILFVTGRGSVTGSPISPTLKITGNDATYRKLEADMDFNAGGILTGRCSLAEATECLSDLVEATAAGTPTKSESLGHREYIINYKYQDAAAKAKACGSC